MKSYTDLEQSKKLLELGIDVNTADMHYSRVKDEEYDWIPLLSPIPKLCAEYIENIPCWSLTALLRLMPRVGHSFPELCRGKETGLFYMWLDEEFDTQKYSNPIDAAVEMIIWLKENGKL